MINIIGVTGLVESETGAKCSAGAGKDVVADYLVQKYGFVSISLADPIKRICQDLWEFSDNQLWGPSELRNSPDSRYWISEEPHPRGVREEMHAFCDQEVFSGMFEMKGPYLTPRHALQQIGTEVGRLVDPEVWVRYAMRVANALLLEEGVDYSKQKGLFGNPLAQTPRGIVIPDVRFPNEMKGIRKRFGALMRVRRQVEKIPHNTIGHASETSLLDVPDSEFDHVLENYGTLEDLYLKVDQLVSRIGLG